MINISKEGFVYDTGWKRKKHIILFGADYEIDVKLTSYFEKDGITVEQETEFKKFKKNEHTLLLEAEKLLNETDAAAEKRFTPEMFLIERNGRTALLCNDAEDVDNGVAVCLYPTKEVVTQDEYL